MTELYQPVQAIDPVAPVPSILTTARRLSSSIVWKSGITWRPRNKPGDEPALHIDDVVVCDETTTIGLDDVTNEDATTAKPFLARLPFFCEDVLPGDLEVYRGDATKALEAATAYAVSYAFYQSDAIQDAADVSASGPVHPATALAILLANYTGCTMFGGAVVHVAPVLIPTLLGVAAIKQVGDVYQGPLGSLVSPGPFGLWANDEGTVTSTMYVTGPVEWDAGPISIPLDDRAARWDRRQNGYYIEAQRSVIARADDTCTFKVDSFLPSPGSDDGTA